MKINENIKQYAPALVRFGISGVILWFGFYNLFTDKLAGYIPAFVYSLGISIHLLLVINGLFEIIFGLILLLGIFTRISSLILGIHLIVIIIGLGYNDVFIRDLGLMVITFGVFINGPDKFCLDNKIWKK